MPTDTDKTPTPTRLQFLYRHLNQRYYVRTFAGGKENWTSPKTTLRFARRVIADGILPLSTLVDGSWLKLAKSIQRIVKRWTRECQHPQSPTEISERLEGAVGVGTASRRLLNGVGAGRNVAKGSARRARG